MEQSPSRFNMQLYPNTTLGKRIGGKSNCAAINDVLADLENLGVEKDGPVPKLQSNNFVEVLEIPFYLTEE